MARILIADDDHHVRQLLGDILQASGHQCQSVENAAQAREILGTMQFDLLLSDLEMPGESGVELIASIKDRYPLMAVVIISVLDDPNQVRNILELGLYGYIVKPFTKNLVLISIENALRLHRLELQEQQRTRSLKREVVTRTKCLDEQLYFLQTLIDTIPVPVYYKDRYCVFLGCNRAFEASVGVRREAIIGRTVFDLYPPDVAEDLHRRDLDILQTGKVQAYEREKRLMNGKVQWGSVHKAVFCDSAGTISGLVGVVLDISELKRTEHSLRRSEEKLRSLMDNLHIGVITFNTNWEVLQINRQMRGWFPQLQDTAEGSRNFKQFLLCLGPQSGMEELFAGDLFNGGKNREIKVSLHTAESERIFRTVFSPVDKASGDVTEVVGLLEDITDKLAMERDLNQAQKLESIGQLAAGIAHEINTPAQFIGTNIGFLSDAFLDLNGVLDKMARELDAQADERLLRQTAQELTASLTTIDWPYLREEVPSAIQQSQDGIHRITTIVQAMKEFSHPSGKEKVEYDINKLIKTTIVVASNEWKYSAEVETDYAEDLPSVPCLADELGQVFLNILVNAIHAIEGQAPKRPAGQKGRIRFVTRRDGDWVEVQVADNGCGIPEAIQSRIFDPFFTTKGVGKGTGQGLAICRDVVTNKHGGSLTFSSKPGEGTIFFVRLPINPTK